MSNTWGMTLRHAGEKEKGRAPFFTTILRAFYGAFTTCRAPRVMLSSIPLWTRTKIGLAITLSRTTIASPSPHEALPLDGVLLAYSSQNGGLRDG